MKIRKPSPQFILLFVFGIIYLSIVIANHYFFRTWAFDYGLYNNAFYDYAHFRINDNPVFNPPLENFLQDHLAIPVMILSPFYWIMGWLTGTYTLLILEVAFILIGGYFTFLLVKLKTDNQLISIIALFHFMAIIGHFTALSSDYHDTVVGASLVPVFIYFLERRKFLWSTLLFFFVLFTKENMALWLIGIGLTLILLNLKDKQLRKANLIYIAISLVYFVVAFKYIIPFFAQPNKPYWNFHYHALGSSMPEVIKNLIIHPGETIRLLFVNPGTNSAFDLLKSEFYWVFALSGGFVLLYRPQYLIMFVPLIAQNMFNDRYVCWGIGGYYVIEVVSILSLSVFIILGQLRNKKLGKYLSLVVLVSTLILTVVKLDRQALPWYNGKKEQFYSAKMYRADFDVRKVNQGLKVIPDTAKVVASENLVSHLAFRQKIYCFPNVRDAEYAAFLLGQSTFPLLKEKFELRKNEMINSKEWELYYQQDSLLILKRVFDK